MAELQQLIFNPDMMEINEEYLEPLAEELNIKKHRGSENGIGSQLWAKMEESPKIKSEISDKLKGYIFAGQTSVTWYVFYKAKENLVIPDEKMAVCIPLETEISNTPTFVGMTEIKEGEHLARFVVRTGFSRRVYGISSSTVPKITFVTVLISTNNDFIEIRSEPKLASKILSAIRKKFIPDDDVTIAKVENFTDTMVEKLVKELDGKLIETLSHPERLFENVDSNKAEAMVLVLEAVNNYFANSDSMALMTQLNAVGKLFKDQTIPFIALVLAGMDKISMGMMEGGDLRNQALFNAIKPYIKYLRGYISFPVVENNITKMYTIRIGLTTNSVYFNSSASEKVIEAVRNKVLSL